MVSLPAISRRRAFLGLAALALGPRAVALGRRLIRIGSSGNYPPFTFLDGAGRMSGILPDLLGLIGDKADLRFEFGDLPWARAQKMVEAGQVDGLCTVATAERRIYAVFAPTPLYEEPDVLVYRTGNARAEAVRSVKDLAHLRIGAPLGSSMIKDALPGLDIIWAADTDNLLSMLAAGHIDGALLGAWTAQAKLKAYRDQGILRVKKLHLPVDGAIRFGLRKSYPDAEGVLASIDSAIRSVKASGAVADIIGRYAA